jgi:hypothetical protein
MVALVLLGLVCAQCARHSNSPTDILSRVPLGSKLIDLDKYVGDFGLKPGDVMQFGSFGNQRDTFSGEAAGERNLGRYDKWRASMGERKRFSGKILFYLEDVLMNMKLLEFTYMNGKLIQKDWGNLPG